MEKIMRTTVCGLMALAITMAFTNQAIAAKDDDDDPRNPLGCLDVGYQFNLKTLTLLPSSIGKRNSLYFILNKSKEPITLYQMRAADSTRSMHLNHTIHARRWAVLSTCEKDIKYICAMKDRKRPFGKIVDCAEHVQVCEFSKVRFGINTRGNTWIVNSNTRNGAVREVVRFGIIPQ